MPDGHDDSTVLRTVEEVRALVPVAVRELEQRPDIARAAAVDPVRAFELLGYRVDPALVPTLQRLVRFSRDAAARLETLGAEVQEAAGRPVDVDDAEDLERLLFDELTLPRPHEDGEDGNQHADRGPGGGRVTDPLPVAWGTDAPDRLQPLYDAHPVMPPLLAYRRLEASRPRLGDEQDFRRALQGEGLQAVDTVRFRLRTSGS
jgi:hypothetical protein